MKTHIILSLLAATFFVAGCGNSGVFLASNNTEVQLKEGNYTIVAKSVTGSAESAYLLGGSYSWGMVTNSMGLIPLSGTKTLYKDAREALWTNFEAEHPPVEGRKLALVNIQYDGATANYVLYTSAKVTITADIIEFE